MATLDILSFGVVTGTASGAGSAARIDGASTPVDTSSALGAGVPANTLRQDIAITLDRAACYDLAVDVFIETGPSSTGPWKVLDAWSSDRDGFEDRRRVVVSGLDTFVRLAWALRGSPALNAANASSDFIPKPILSIGSTGEAL